MLELIPELLYSKDNMLELIPELLYSKDTVTAEPVHTQLLYHLQGPPVLGCVVQYQTTTWQTWSVSKCRSAAFLSLSRTLRSSYIHKWRRIHTLKVLCKQQNNNQHKWSEGLTNTIYRFWHDIARKRSRYTMLRLTEIQKEDDNPTGHSPSFLRLTSICTTNSR